MGQEFTYLAQWSTQAYASTKRNEEKRTKVCSEREEAQRKHKRERGESQNQKLRSHAANIIRAHRSLTWHEFSKSRLNPQFSFRAQLNFNLPQLNISAFWRLTSQSHTHPSRFSSFPLSFSLNPNPSSPTRYFPSISLDFHRFSSDFHFFLSISSVFSLI